MTTGMVTTPEENRATAVDNKRRNLVKVGLLEAAWLRHYNIVSLKRSDGRRPPEDDVASRAWFRQSPRSSVMPLFLCSIRADILLGIGGFSLPLLLNQHNVVD